MGRVLVVTLATLDKEVKSGQSRPNMSLAIQADLQYGMRGVFAGRLAGQEQEIPYMQQVMSHASTAGKENGSVAATETRRIYKSQVVKYLIGLRVRITLVG
jgi:hypothetical protein